MQDATTFGGFVSQEHIEVSALYGRHHHQSLLEKKVRQVVSSLGTGICQIVFFISDFITLGLLLRTRKEFAIQVIGKTTAYQAYRMTQYCTFFPSRPYTSSILILLLHSPEYIYILGEQSRSESTRHYRKCVQNSLRTQNLRPLKKAAAAGLIDRPRLAA